jgi:hypothetical protein
MLPEIIEGQLLGSVNLRKSRTIINTSFITQLQLLTALGLGFLLMCISFLCSFVVILVAATRYCLICK